MSAPDELPFGVVWEDDLTFLLGERPLRVAFDVGAHRGETARRLVRRFPGVTVHAFEPMADNAAALRAATQDLSVHCVAAAVSDRNARALIGRGPDSMRGGFGAPGDRVAVATVTLDGYAARHGVRHVDLLKVDTEGHEAAVLRGGRALLTGGGVDFVLCECEFIARPDEPHGDFAEILGLLAPLGFRVVSFYTGGVDDLGWRWGDVLFRRVVDARPGWVMRSPHADRPPFPPHD
jgi:FkbM family methyltransferase